LPEKTQHEGFATVLINYNTGLGFEDETEVPERRGKEGGG
jgi:hypothetical protein